MRSRKYGFFRHYRKIKIEGTGLAGFVNKCMKNGIFLRNIRWKDPVESSVEVSGDDFDAFRKTAGHSYKLTVTGEGGAIPFLRSLRSRISAIAGAFVLGAFIFYQSLFVAEIRIDGYRSISEEQLRHVMSEAGLFEGARRQNNYNAVKSALYSEFDNIAWVGIHEAGKMVEVEISESSDEREAEPADETPVDIVAARSGVIERILPLQGEALVKNGDYVNKGDVLISGTLEYQSTDYSRGDGFFYRYSHASGEALAKTPRRLTYYIEKNVRVKEPTGRHIPGIYVKIGDFEVDTASWFSRFAASERREKMLIDAVRPLPVRIGVTRVDEVTIKESHRDMNRLSDMVDAAVRQYARENFGSDSAIADHQIDYTESAGVIRADVLLEVLEDIGKEKVIKIKENEEKEKAVAGAQAGSETAE